MSHARARKVLVIIASFYRQVADLQRAGAIASLEAAQVAYDVIEVPGALEIPSVIAMARANDTYQGYVALGCVIRGETFHFEIVAHHSAEGLMRLMTEHGLAIGNGILTVESMEQAIVRADPKAKNLAGNAAEACLRLMELQSLWNH